MNTITDERLRLSPDAVLRVVAPNRVKLVANGSALTIPLDLCKVALAFATPRTIAEAIDELDADASPEDIREILSPLLRSGALIVDRPAIDAVSLQHILNRDTFRDPETLARIGRAIADDRAVLIPRAFDDDWAERVHLDLEHCTRWEPEQTGAEYFHYRQHGLRDATQFPDAVREVARVFQSGATKALLGEVTGCDCSGPLWYAASLYLPGDYSLPHSDAWGSRTLSFVWYLSKNWKPEWGGHFVWCPTGAIVSPMFNSLVLFRASMQSLHAVSPVSPQAQGRRISINGSWCAATDMRFTAPTPSPGATLLPGVYNGGTQPLDGTDMTLL
jgi:hypothetical protein